VTLTRPNLLKITRSGPDLAGPEVEKASALNSKAKDIN